MRVNSYCFIVVACLIAGATANPGLAQEPAVEDASAPVEAAGTTVDAIPDSLTLQWCLERALVAHPDVLTAYSTVRRAMAAATAQRSRLYPQVNASWSVRHSQSLQRPLNVGGGTISTSGGRSTQRDAEVGLSYQIYTSGLRDRVRQSDVSAEAAAEAIDEARRLLAYDVRTAYYGILAARRYAEVALRAVQAAQRHREMVEARIAAGLAPESDLLPIKVKVSEARLESVRAETDLEMAFATLKAVLGLPAEARFDLAEALPRSANLQVRELFELMETAREERPDVRRQALSVRAAQLGVKATEAENGLQVTAAASGDYGRHTGVTGETWDLRLGVQYPLFDAGRARAEIAQSREDQVQAQERLASLQLDLQQQVESAYHALVRSAAAVEAAQLRLDDAQNSLTAAEARYRAGLAVIIEVTDAEQNLRRAEFDLAGTLYDHVLREAALARAVGVEPAELLSGSLAEDNEQPAQ